MTNPSESSGVQTFIDKLREQGIVSGQKQAEQIIKDAQTKANQILMQAQAEADKLLSETRLKIETEKKASHEAIKTAFRDSELALRSRLKEAFSAHLRRLVSLQMTDSEFIKQLVLAIAKAKTGELETPVEIQMPAKIFEEKKQQLQHLVLGITHDMLRQGIELMPSSEIKGGIKVCLVGQDLQIDLTDEALSNLLLRYLLPRYKEIVSGQDSA